MCSNTGTSKALSYFTASFPVFLIILPIPGNFLVCLAIIKDPFRNLKTPFNYFLLSLASTNLVVGTIMDSVSVAFRISKGLQLNIVDIKILHILYFILCTASILILMAHTVERYVAVSSPVLLYWRWYSRIWSTKQWLPPSALFNIPVNLVGSTRVFFCILPTRIYILLLHFYKYCCSQHVWVLIFVHVGILKRLRQRSRYWRKRG